MPDSVERILGRLEAGFEAQREDMAQLKAAHAESREAWAAMAASVKQQGKQLAELEKTVKPMVEIYRRGLTLFSMASAGLAAGIYLFGPTVRDLWQSTLGSLLHR